MAATVYKGVTICKNGSRWELLGYHWGDQPGEGFRFPTLKSAKAFIDRTIAPGHLYPYMKG